MLRIVRGLQAGDDTLLKTTDSIVFPLMECMLEEVVRVERLLSGRD